MKLPKLLFSLLACIVICSAFVTEKNKTTIWMVGDSTMAKKKSERFPESGWGEGLAEFVNKNAKVKNRAASGRSTLSFINEGRWKNVADSLQPGDYVIMQFGHNDEKPTEKLHTDAFGSFKENLKKFIDETRERKATPIVCSSIVRRHFDATGKLKDTHGDYITAAKQVATETNTLYIDMEALTRKYVTGLGPEKSKALYTFTEKVQDSTHLSMEGSRGVAKLFVEEAKSRKAPISKILL